MNSKKVVCISNGSFEYKGNCVSKCPNDTLLSNGSCVTECSPHEGWFDKLSSYGSIEFIGAIVLISIILGFVLFIQLVR
jgi:hypothetical protein